jgi:hypothetical protein
VDTAWQPAPNARTPKKSAINIGCIRFTPRFFDRFRRIICQRGPAALCRIWRQEASPFNAEHADQVSALTHVNSNRDAVFGVVALPTRPGTPASGRNRLNFAVPNLPPLHYLAVREKR